MAINFGEIYVCRGYGKARPFVVVSREDLNRGAYIVGVPLTRGNLAERKSLPNCVLLQKGEAGLDEECVAHCEQITVMNRDQLGSEPMGQLASASLGRLIQAIGYVMGSECRKADTP